MRRCFETEWHGIQFSDFSRLSSRELAGPAFYDAFYGEFFKRYRNWEQLSPEWLRQKENCAEFVLARSENASRILSISCGLGAMERHIRGRRPDLDLFVHEMTTSPWRWIGSEFSDEHKFLGRIPACLPGGIRFDLAYLSAVDYALDDGALVHLLGALRPFLIQPEGQCLLISASFLARPASLLDKTAALVRSAKATAAAALDHLGLRPRGQFWGWLRSQEEYRRLMRLAGYHRIEDGFLGPGHRFYWISGT